MNRPNALEVLSDQDRCYREVAQIILADLETDWLEQYALISIFVRYRLKGVRPEFIGDSINELREAVAIEIE